MTREISGDPAGESEGKNQGQEREALVLGVIAHELRSPLASLRAMAEFLLTEEARALGDWEFFHQSIHDEIVRLSDLLDNLLEAARIASGKARWNWDEVRLDVACSEALDGVRYLIDRSRIALEFEVRPPDAVMKGDRDAVQRLILNLLNNSRRHTTEGRIQVDAAIVDDAAGAWCAITVTDTGSGMEPHVVARLGAAFALNSGVVDAGGKGGTGLGLAICNSIAAAHGGSMSVRSAAGEGTSITARLRADLAEPATDKTLSIRFVSQTRPAGDSGKAELTTVLVVDDNADSVELLAKMLRLHGHPVETASHGMEALSVLARVRPDVVILDLMMPVMDGVSFLEVMRRNPAWKDIRVVAFTGYGDRYPAQRLAELGVAEVLPKGSTDFRDLLKVVA